jgi:hypothetical protein
MAPRAGSTLPPDDEDEEDNVLPGGVMPPPVRPISPVARARPVLDAGRLSDDPQERAKQSMARAEADFEAKQRAVNPFLYSGAVKSLAKVGGRRYMDRAVQAGEAAYADQVQAERARAVAERQQQVEAQKAQNAQREAQMRGTRQQFYTDPYGNIQPVLDPTGRPLYRPTTWSASKHPKDGRPVMEMLDQYGQRQFKDYPLVTTDDPNDMQMHWNVDGEFVPAMSIDDAIKRGGKIAKQARVAREQKLKAQIRESTAPARREVEAVDLEIATKRAEVADLNRRSEELARAGDAVRAAEMANSALALEDELNNNAGELGARKRLADARYGYEKIRAERDGHLVNRQEIADRLIAEGIDPASDPGYQANEKALAQVEKTLGYAKAALGRMGQPVVAQPATPVAAEPESRIKSVGKALARGATAERIYAAGEGLARLMEGIGRTGWIPGFGAAPRGMEGAARWYGNATRDVRKAIREALPLDEEFSRSLTGQVSQGIGQAIGTLLTAALGPAGLAVASIGQIYDEAYQDAKQAGASDSEANAAAVKYLPAAGLDFLSDRLVVGRIMKPLVGKMTVGAVLKDILVSAVAEGATEGAQQAYLNQVASKLAGYDPNRVFDKEVYDSMLVGAITGGVVTGAGRGARAALSGGEPEGGNVQTPEQPPVEGGPPATQTPEQAQAEAEFQRALAEEPVAAAEAAPTPEAAPAPVQEAQPAPTEQPQPAEQPAAEELPAGRPPVVEQSPEATATDRRQYDMLQRRMSELLKRGGADAVGSPEYQAAWQASEDIKNRHGGMPPGEVAGEPRPVSQPSTEETQNASIQQSATQVGEQPVGTQGPRIEGGSGVEQSVEGIEPPRAQASAVPGEPSVSSQEVARPTAELRRNNADLGQKPVAQLSRAEKYAELEAAGVKQYKGKPVSELNPAELSAAVGQARRGGESQPLLTERAEAALRKAKIDTRGKVFDVTGATAAAAWNAAIDLAILGVKAGRPIEQVIRIAIARYKAAHKAATEAELARLDTAIRSAVSQPPEPTPKGKEKSRLPESLRAAGAPVESIEYEVRNQEARKQEASEFVRKNGPEAAEAALTDAAIPGDTRVAIGGQLINDRMMALAEAKPEKVRAITRDIQRITAKMQPELATKAGQQISMFSAIYQDVATAAGMEYIREAGKRRSDALGGERGEQAAQEAADIFNRKLTPEERNKEIERLKERYTEKPVRKMLNEFKRMQVAQKLNELGVLTREDMIEVAGNALGIPGIDPKKLKHIAQLADKVKGAKNEAERAKAEIELADALSVYKGLNPLDLEASILTLNILSGPSTQLANLGGNTLQSLSELVSTAATNPSQTPALVQGLIYGMGLGATEAKSILQTGRGSRDFQDKTNLAGSSLQTVDYARDFPKVGKAAGAVLTARARLVEKVSRVMKATDAIFYYPAREAYARMVVSKLLEGKVAPADMKRAVDEVLHITPVQFKQAEAAAKAEGWEGIDLARRTADIIEERRAQRPEGAEAVRQSEQFAAEATYNQEPVGLAGVVYRNAANLVNQARVGGAPILKPWLMFLRTPANVFNATTNYTPMGAVRAKLGMPDSKPGEWKNFTREERKRLYLQSLIGTSLMSALIWRVLEKEDLDVTARGPENPAQRRQLMQGGWMPYSIKVGDRYYSYKDSPLLVPLSVVGNVADAVKYQKAKADQLLENRVTDALFQAPRVMFQTSMLSGLANLMSSLSGTGPTTDIGRELGGLPANLAIPYNRLLQQVDQVFEPRQFQTGAVQSNVPFLRREGQLKTDVQGRPETYSPFSRFGSPESKDPVDVLIRDKHVFIPDVDRSAKIGDKPMTDEQIAEYRRISGERIRSRLLRMVPILKAKTKEDVQDEISRVSREERDRAKKIIARQPIER